MTLVLLPGLIRSVPAFWARMGLYDRRSNLTVQTLIRFNEPQELTWPVLTWVKPLAAPEPPHVSIRSRHAHERPRRRSAKSNGCLDRVLCFNEPQELTWLS